MKLTIDYVSKFGAIKHEGKWINPAKNSRIKFTNEDIGKEVILTLDSEGKYVDYMSEGQAEQREDLIKKLNQEIGTKFDSKSLDIHRQVALKCAVDFLKDKGVSTHNLIETAEELEQWLNR